MVTNRRKVKWLTQGQRKPPKICESAESDSEDSEMVEPTVKIKPPKGLDTMPRED